MFVAPVAESFCVEISAVDRRHKRNTNMPSSFTIRHWRRKSKEE
jgi:hypothetical protein